MTGHKRNGDIIANMGTLMKVIVIIVSKTALSEP
jgi:hypothetical protein